MSAISFFDYGTYFCKLYVAIIGNMVGVSCSIAVNVNVCCVMCCNVENMSVCSFDLLVFCILTEKPMS